MGLTLDGRANPRRLASGTLPRASHDAPKPALCKAPHLIPPGPLASPLALNSASADSLPQAPKSSGLRPGPSPPAASDEAPDIFRDVARQPELLLSALGSIDRDSRGWPFESDLKLVLTHWQRLLHPPRYSDRRFVIDGRRAKDRLYRLRKNPRLARLLPKEKSPSLEEFQPVLAEFFSFLERASVAPDGASGKPPSESVPSACAATVPSCGADSAACCTPSDRASAASPRPFENVGRRWAAYAMPCDGDSCPVRPVTPEPSVAPDPEPASAPGPADNEDTAVEPMDVDQPAVAARRHFGAPFPWLLPTHGLPPARLRGLVFHAVACGCAEDGVELTHVLSTHQ